MGAGTGTASQTTASWTTGRAGSSLASVSDALPGPSDDGVTITSVRGEGAYGYVELIANNRWAFGVSAGLYEHAEDSSEESWDGGVFVTHRINEFNRLRVEARHFEDPGPNSYGLALQWTMILGSHGHGIDW